MNSENSHQPNQRGNIAMIVPFPINQKILHESTSLTCLFIDKNFQAFRLCVKENFEIYIVTLTVCYNICWTLRFWKYLTFFYSCLSQALRTCHVSIVCKVVDVQCKIISIAHYFNCPQQNILSDSFQLFVEWEVFSVKLSSKCYCVFYNQRHCISHQECDSVT